MCSQLGKLSYYVLRIETFWKWLHCLHPTPSQAVIFKPAPKAAEGLPATASAIDPAPHHSEEVSVITEEPRDKTAAVPTEAGLAVAAVGTSSENVV